MGQPRHPRQRGQSKQAARRRAIAAELDRRRQQAQAACPLSRDEFQSLVDAVQECVDREWHDGTFRHARAWLAERPSLDARVLASLPAHGIACDWDLALAGLPPSIFGCTDGQLVVMPLAEGELQALLSWLEGQLARQPCAHDTALTRQWLRRHEHGIPKAIFALAALGGFCDCEVLMNVEPADIFAPGSSGPRAGAD